MAAHATLDPEQLISHTRTLLVDAITSLQCSWEVTAASEVNELETKTPDILDNGISHWVDNAAHILAYLFNSASRQCHNDWTSQF